MLSSRQTQQPERLNSWKSIAAYFERDERTVKRWEAQRGLPVHRVPGAGRSSVYAYTHELAQWLKRADTQSLLSTGDDASSREVASPLAPSETPETASPAEPLSAPVAAAVASSGWNHRKAMVAIVAAATLAFALASFLVYRHFALSRLTFASSRSAPNKHSVSPEAEELYLQGIYHWNKRTPESLNLALDDFTQSIVRDPNYAPAYAGLANCYNLLREYTRMPAAEAYPRAIAAAERAIVLDDSLSDAHNALAFADFYWNWDAAGAESEFERAIGLDPNSVVAHHWYATFLMVLGRSQQALREIEKARLLDPQSSSILADKGLILFHAGQTAQSVALLKRIEAADPAFLSPHSYLALIDFRTRDYPDYLGEARKAAQLLGDGNQLRTIAAAEKGLATSGADGMLRAILSVQNELYARGQLSAFELAETHCLLGDKQEALRLLSISVSKREQQAVALRVEACFSSLHHDATFARLLTEAGLPPLG